MRILVENSAYKLTNLGDHAMLNFGLRRCANYFPARSCMCSPARRSDCTILIRTQFLIDRAIARRGAGSG